MLTPWKESYDRLSILKSRDISLPTKAHVVKAMAFPVVMYECESWTTKKVEHGRIYAFELSCWRRLLRVPWTTRKSTLNTHCKDWCWSWSSNILVTWCEQPTLWKRPWCWERLKAEEKRVSESHQRMKRLDDITDAVDMNLGKLWEMVRDREAWHAAVQR